MIQSESFIVSVGERNSSFYGPFSEESQAQEFAKSHRDKGIQAIVFPLRSIKPVEQPLAVPQPVEPVVPRSVVDPQPDLAVVVLWLVAVGLVVAIGYLVLVK